MLKSTLYLAAAAFLALAPVVGCNDDEGTAGGEFYVMTPLVSDQAGMAEHTDPELVNPWGIAFGADTFFWIANNGTGSSTLYDGKGVIKSQAIGGPVTMTSLLAGETVGPTGVVFNGNGGFNVSVGPLSATSPFIFATTEGTLLGWSPEVDLHSGVITVDASEAGAVYTGLAIATSGGRTLIYAADFANGVIDVYDDTFAPATGLVTDAFMDPTLPVGYSPFGIQEIDGTIYIMYALVDTEAAEEIPGLGNGYVDAFNPDGSFVARVASGGPLNAPWGIALAPDSFGEFGGALLVGNLGDGRITAIDPVDYTVLGQLKDEQGAPIEIEGLWGLTFGNDRMAGESDDLYFTAGIADETHGMFGEIAVGGEAEGE